MSTVASYIRGKSGDGVCMESVSLSPLTHSSKLMAGFMQTSVKAMLHEAMFLATCNATMTNKKPFKLQRGSHTFATFFATCNAYNNKQDGGRPKSPTSCER